MALMLAGFIVESMINSMLSSTKIGIDSYRPLAQRNALPGDSVAPGSPPPIVSGPEFSPAAPSSTPSVAVAPVLPEQPTVPMVAQPMPASRASADAAIARTVGTHTRQSSSRETHVPISPVYVAHAARHPARQKAPVRTASIARSSHSVYAFHRAHISRRSARKARRIESVPVYETDFGHPRPGYDEKADRWIDSLP